jgi:hypothetical protein
MRSGRLRLTGTDSLNESIQATGSRSNGWRREGEEISPARVPATNFRGGRLRVGRWRCSGGFCRREMAWRGGVDGVSGMLKCVLERRRGAARVVTASVCFGRASKCSFLYGIGSINGVRRCAKVRGRDWDQRESTESLGHARIGDAHRRNSRPSVSNCRILAASQSLRDEGEGEKVWWKWESARRGSLAMEGVGKSWPRSWTVASPTCQGEEREYGEREGVWGNGLGKDRVGRGLESVLGRTGCLGPISFLIWARRRRWSPISGLHQNEGSSLLIGTPGQPTIWDNLV